MNSIGMQKIIITDFTRFSNPKIVGTAGIDLTTGQCIRPMPHLNTVFCKSENIVPGAILTGEFTPVQNIAAPHQEDMSYKNLSCIGLCTSSEFKLALNAGLCDTVENGFQIALADKQKHRSGRDEIERNEVEIVRTAGHRVSSFCVQPLPRRDCRSQQGGRFWCAGRRGPHAGDTGNRAELA